MNDHDYNFCKVCGVKRDLANSTNYLSDNELKVINDRIDFLDNLCESKSYAKQKSKLEDQLSNFITRLGANKSLINVLPEDIRKFIVFKESSGRTQLHRESCLFRGTHGKQDCQCKVTMSHKSVDSLVGKLRAIFRDMGRTGEWSDITRQGNPMTCRIFQKHIAAMKQEQCECDVSVKKAVPLLFDKLGCLCRYLSYQISIEHEKISKFILLRDRAYFSLIAHSVDRANDLGLLSLDDIYNLPDDMGIFVSQTKGKSFDVHHPNNYVVLKSKDMDICPILHLKAYIKHALDIGIDLHAGYLFLTRHNITHQITAKPVSSNLMADRLKTHLSSINMYQGESGHSTRRGSSLLLLMLGQVDDQAISNHVGWRSANMLRHYANVGKLMGPSSVASRLSEASDRTNGISQLEEASLELNKISNLKKFYP